MSCEAGNCCGLGEAKSILRGIEFPIPKNQSVTEYFRKCIIEGAICADAPAILSGDGQSVAYTFNSLDSLSTKVAKALRFYSAQIIRRYLGFWTSNNPDGDLVMAFCLPASEIIPVLIVAILKLGATFLSIPTTYTEQHIVTVVGVTRPMIVITEETGPTRARYECVSGLLMVVGIDEILNMALTEGFDDINEVFPLETLAKPSKRMACIVYTPGTMDQPLAVRIGHPEILNRCLWQYKVFPYTNDEVASVSSGLEDVDCIAEMFAPLLAGIPCHIFPKNVLTKPTSLIWRIFEAKISRITLMPPALSLLLDAYSDMAEEEKVLRPLLTLKYYIVSGDTLSIELATKYFDIVCPYSTQDGLHNQHPNDSKSSSKSHLTKFHSILVHLYGSTEMMGDVTYESFEHCSSLSAKFRDGKVSIGRPIGNTIIYVVDEDLKIVEEGAIGEICVAGACVASGGYVTGTEIEDSERFCPNTFTKKKLYSTVYQTEDFGRILKSKKEEPSLYYEGRTEMTAKVMGKRVDLRDIVKCVNDTNLVEQCSVFCYHPEKEDQALVACCKLLPDVTEEQLLLRLKEIILDEHLIPRIFPVETFRYLPSGRLDKRKLMKLYHFYSLNVSPEEWDTLNLTSSSEKNAAKVLFTTIAKISGKPLRTIISQPHSSMWSLGVNSLNALTIFSKLSENGYIIPIDAFLKADSIISLVSQMEIRTKQTEIPVAIQHIHLLQLAKEQFTVKELQIEDKEEVVEMLGYAYSAKNELGIYQMTSSEDFGKFCECNWAEVMKANLSVVALTRTIPQRLAGAMLVLDGFTQPKRPSNCPNSVKYIWELIDTTERGPKEHFVWKKKGTATILLMLGTSLLVPTMKNILIIALLLEMSKIKAKLFGYSGAIISSANPLIRELCTVLRASEVVEEIPIFKFRSKDKTKPFRLAQESQKLQVLYERF